MGSWDYYCSLCGAGFGFYGCLPPQEEFEHIRRKLEEGGEYNRTEQGELDPLICSYGTLEWLNHLRLLGHNPHGQEGRGVFLSGLGTDDDYGSSSVDPGDHPNVLREDGPDIQVYYIYSHRKLRVSTYLNCARGPGPRDYPLPIHDRCITMVRRVLSGQPDGQIDLDTLYEAMGIKRGGYQDKTDPRPYNNSSLFLDYYQFNRSSKEQFWGSTPGLDPWYNDPVDIPAVPKLLNDLPRAAPAPKDKASDPAKDPFSRLPLELLVEVIMRLPKESLVSFFLSSRAARLASRSQWVWKKRITIDMPWLWEFHEKKEYPNDVEWQAVYGKLIWWSLVGKWAGLEVGEGGITPDQRLELGLSGLASRSRIWQCCEQVRELYEKQMSESSAKT